MTHQEALTLLPAYAVGALDQDIAALDAHLETCAECRQALATYLETTTRLGEAVEQVTPPPHLRQRVLGASAFQRRDRWWTLGQPLASLAVAAILVLALGLATWGVVQRIQLQREQATLALDERGLALLTSTETTVVRLEPLASGTQAHGHWYHRPGIMTQVLVVEFLPPAAPGTAYYGWLQHKNGVWQLAGRFTLDATGYDRLILLGSDGSDVQRIVVTQEAQPAAAPAGQLVLHWPAP